MGTVVNDKVGTVVKDNSTAFMIKCRSKRICILCPLCLTATSAAGFQFACPENTTEFRDIRAQASERPGSRAASNAGDAMRANTREPFAPCATAPCAHNDLFSASA